VRRKTRKKARRRPAARRAPKRKTYRRRNYMSAGVHPRPNRKRRRNVYARSKRRNYHRRNKYLRNPRVLGFELPNLRESVAAAAGFLLPPVLESYAAPYLPAMITTNMAGRWALRVGSVAGIGAALGRFIGRREGKLALIGGGVWLVSTAVQEFFPGMLPAPAVSGQPLLGAYSSMYAMPGNIPPEQTAMTFAEPDRLMPTSRF